MLREATGAREAAGTEFDLEQLEPSSLAIRLVPERLARRHSVIPVAADNRTLTFATCRPFDPEAERDVAFASGRRTRMLVASRSAVKAALDRWYPRLHELDLLAERIRAGRPDVDSSDTDRPAGVSQSAVVEMCDHLIGRAVDVGASDVHIDGGKTGTVVTYRTTASSSRSTRKCSCRGYRRCSAG